LLALLAHVTVAHATVAIPGDTDGSAVSVLVSPEGATKPVTSDVHALLAELMRMVANMNQNLTDRIAELQGDVAELKVDVAELKGDVATLKGDVAELKDHVRDIRYDMPTLAEAGSASTHW